MLVQSTPQGQILYAQLPTDLPGIDWILKKQAQPIPPNKLPDGWQYPPPSVLKTSPEV